MLSKEEAENARRMSQPITAPIPSSAASERHYYVTLKSGETQIFTDTRNLANFRDILVSGMYGIAMPRKGVNITLSPDNVASIDEIVDGALVGETEVGNEEQEAARKKELLSE